jgi:transmembrane sensor
MSDEFRPLDAVDADLRWEAIARHVAGESDPAEAAAVTAWLATHPEDAALVAVVKARELRAESMAQVSVDTEQALASVRARMASAPTLSVERGGAAGSRRAQPVSAPRRSWRSIGFAAAAGLAAIVGVSQYRSTRADAAAPRDYRTAVGQRDSIRLPDGSTVVLAPGSRLTLAPTFASGARDVTLEGAAFFVVEHDAAHPFTVHAAGADIHDIGTAFSVKTASDGGVSVAVTHGIVSLGSAGTTTEAPVELRAGDRGVLTSGRIAVRRGVVTDDDVAWTRGLLAYRDAPMGEVQADLQRWYGIDLRVSDSLLARRTLTASFRGDSAAQVIQLIALALGAQVVQQGDTVFLQPGPGIPPIP